MDYQKMEEIILLHRLGYYIFCRLCRHPLEKVIEIVPTAILPEDVSAFFAEKYGVVVTDEAAKMLAETVNKYEATLDEQSVFGIIKDFIPSFSCTSKTEEHTDEKSR